MDERYYIIGALALVLALLAVYVLASIVRYRRAVHRSRVPQSVMDAEGEAKYLAEDDSARAAFAVPTVPAPDASIAPSPGMSSAVATPVTAPRAAAPVTRPVLEPELLEQPDEPRRVALGPGVAPVSTGAPDIDELTRLVLSLEALDGSATVPAPAPVDTLERTSEPQCADAPAPTPAAEAAYAPLPGYSLADELERLMGAATAGSALLPLEAVARDAAPPVAAMSEDRPALQAPPMSPPLSLGQALSGTPIEPLASQSPLAAEVAVTSSAALAPASTSTGRVARPAAVVAAIPAAVSDGGPVTQGAAMAAAPSGGRTTSVEDYALVAPVELHFTGAQGRVGVKPGTRSYAEFQRLAGIMLGDLRVARGR